MAQITLELADDIVAHFQDAAALENRSFDNYVETILQKYCYGEVAFLPKAVLEWQPQLKTTRSRISPRLVALIFHESKGVCAYCATPLQPYFGWEVDHIIPLSRGGTNLPSNLCAACCACNGTKGSLTGEEFRGSMLFQPAKAAP